jgi:hypothetical protein
MKSIRFCIFMALIFNIVGAVSVYSAQYYVDASHPMASDTNSGTEISPWPTIQKAANTVMAGDTCYVKAGTYNERVTPSNSGTRGNLITFAAYQNETVIVRGFNLTSRNYIRVIGFEITHAGSGYNYDGVFLAGSTGCEILHNYIHHTSKNGNGGIRCAYGSPCSNLVIRGNRIEYPGCAAGDTGNCVGLPGINLRGTYNLVEYNEISHIEDYIEFNGLSGNSYNIIRNNKLGTNGGDWADFPDCRTASGGPYCPSDYWHIDGLQTGPIDHIVFERNYMVDNAVSNAHGFIVEGAGDNMIVRENAFVRSGYSGMPKAIDYVQIYNNTVIDSFYYAPLQYETFSFSNYSGDQSQNNQAFNNLFYKSNKDSSGTIYAVTGSSSVTKDYDCYYLSGNPSESHGVKGDPKFVSYATDDFHIASDSSCKARGKVITTVNSADGSGTSFVVADSRPFIGGWGITDAAGNYIGDTIIVGYNSPVKIASVNYSTNKITVARSIPWAKGDSVRLSHQALIPSMGAYEYRQQGYQYDVGITSPKSGSTVSGSVQIQAAVTNEQCVRYVIFYVDSIPVATVNQSPYVYTLNSAGLREGVHKVEARAYALYADSNLVKNAQVDLIVGSVTPPSPPQGLRIVQ